MKNTCSTNWNHHPSPILHAADLGSQSGTNILLADGDVINADAKSSEGSYYGINNDRLQTAQINLASGATINDNYASQMVKGIEIHGANSQVSADSLNVIASGARADGVFIDGNHDSVDLGTGSQVNATATGSVTGITVSNDSRLVADRLTINAKGNSNGNGDGSGLYLYRPGSSADLGSHSTISTQGDKITGVFVFASKSLDGNTGTTDLKANQLLISTSGDQAYGINQQTNTTIDLGKNSTIITTGNNTDGIYTIGDFRADALTIDTRGTASLAVEVQKGGVANIGAGSHVTATADRGIAANGEGATLNFIGSDDNRNTISVAGNYAVSAQNNGATVNLAKTDIAVTGKRYALWAIGGGVINGDDLTIASGAGSTGVSARSGGQITLTGPTVIKMATPEDNAIATEYLQGAAPGTVNATGKMTIDGSVYAGQGDIHLDMQPDSVWTGKAAINPDNGGTLNVALARGTWNMTDDSELSHLTLNDGTVVFPESVPSTLMLGSLSGSGTFAMKARLAELESDLLNVTGNATGAYSLHIANTGKEPAQSDQDVLVVHTGGGGAGFSVPGGKVDAGTWEYSLVKKGNDWYLSQQAAPPVPPAPPAPPVNPDTPVVPDYPDSPVAPPERKTTPSADAILSVASSSHLIFNDELQNLRYRQGDLHDNKGTGAGVWGRWFGSDNHINGAAGSAWTLQQKGMAVGGDRDFEAGENQGLLGAFVSFSDNLIAPTRGGESKVNSSSAGIYSTLFSPSGFYLDGTLKVNHFTNSLFTRMSDGSPVSGSWQRNGVGGALEAGWMLPLPNAFWVEPWVRTTAFNAQTKKVALSNGMTASLGNDRSVQGSVGVNAGYDMLINTVPVKPWIKVAAVHEFIKKNPLWINGSNRFDNDLSGTAGQYGAGVNIQLTEHGSMHVEVDYQHGSHVDTPIMASAGFRINF